MSLDKIAPKEKTIGGNTYQVRILPAGVGLRSAAKLANLIGPGLKGLQGEGEDKFVGFFSDLLSSSALGDQLEYFTRLFGEYTSVKLAGTDAYVELRQVYELHFAANYFELLQWLSFCIEVNHASFFTGAGLNAQKLVALLQDALSSQYQRGAGKPGSSGGSSSRVNSERPTTA
jgi:hypothetical protein